ncbi:MAG: hypothetical protein ACP5VR_04715 [Acidimicrobiales bacterium]
MTMTATIKRVVAGAVAVIVVVVIAWYAALYRPEVRRVATLDSEQGQLASKVSGLQAQFLALRAEQRRVPAERVALKALQQAVPDGPSLDQLLREVNEAAQVSGVRLTSIGTPAPTGWGASGGTTGQSTSTGVPSLAVSLSVNGSSAQVLRLVTALDKQKRLFVVRSFNLNEGSTTGGGGQSTNLVVDAFYANASSDVPTFPGGP